MNGKAEMSSAKVKPSPSTAAGRPPTPQSIAAGGIFACAVAADSLLWYLAVDGNVLLALFLHTALVAAAAGAMAGLKLHDRTLQCVGLLSLLLIGPVGGIGALLAVLPANRFGRGSDVLEEWYERLSSPTQNDSTTLLHQKLVVGRAIRPGSSTVPHFSEVLKAGSLRDQQNVLGLIGLKYAPEYHKALHLALTSPEASIRVQAAAVFTKLREQNKLLLKHCLSTEMQLLDRRQKLEVANDLIKTLESGFLGQAEVRRAQTAFHAFIQDLRASHEDDVELEILTCRLLALADDHEAIAFRAEARLANAPAPLRHLYAKSVRALGRRPAAAFATRTDPRSGQKLLGRPIGLEGIAVGEGA